MADQPQGAALRDSGETFQGKPLYVDGYGLPRQASVFWDGRGKWVATNARLIETGATKEVAAKAFRERWEDLHG